MTHRRFGPAFLLESSLAIVAASVAALTLVQPAWIEAVSGFDPDHNNGSLEWLIVASLVTCSLVCIMLARREWRRLSSSHS